MLHSNLKVGENGNLYFAGVDTTVLAKKYGTPLMLLDEDRIRSRMRTYICAMKKHFASVTPFPLPNIIHGVKCANIIRKLPA